MKFEGRELQAFAEPISAGELTKGEIYFAVNYIDDEMLIPRIETLVFLGKNLEPGDVGEAYFQDVSSHREGITYDSDSDAGIATFYSGAENELNHIFNYEHALEELMRCSLRRKISKGG